MKLFLLLLLLGVALGTRISDVERKQFAGWKLKFGRTYNNVTEEAYRLSVFAKNLEFINRHNAQKGITYGLGLNAFADLTHQEFVDQYLRAPPLTFAHLGVPSSKQIRTVGDLPTKVDWRGTAVTGVKDQGSACAGPNNSS